MAGSKAGGRRAAKKNLEKYGPSFYREIGRLGGKAGKTGGFGSKKVGPDGLTGRERASKVGAIGGAKSSRAPKIINVIVEEER